MIAKTHLWPEGTAELDGSVTTSAVIEAPDQKQNSLWYRLPSRYQSILNQNCDHFVIATLFKAMREFTDLTVHGEVSPSLLRNLDEFQEIWACWMPQKYHKIEIIADSEREPSRNLDAESAIVAFSGGVDSCFTAWRHRTGNIADRQRRDLKAGVMVHGFDIPLDQQEVFAVAAKNSATMLSSIGMDLIPMATNFKEFRQDWIDSYGAQNWVDSHGAAIASCLIALQGGYSAGLIASSSPYHRLTLPWGSNPLTDPLFSSDSFRIVHDAASYIRREKIRAIAAWPEARRFLRVCYKGLQHDRNCGHCEKCIRTILSFRVMQLGLPECFERDVEDQQIEILEGLNGARLYYLEEILSLAQDSSIRDSWVSALEKCVKKNQQMVKRLAKNKHSLLQKVRDKLAVRTRLRALVHSLTSSS
jgi:hypothetical protein